MASFKLNKKYLKLIESSFDFFQRLSVFNYTAIDQKNIEQGFGTRAKYSSIN